MTSEPSITLDLARHINLGRVIDIARWADATPARLSMLLSLSRSSDPLTGRNALWCLTHCRATAAAWLNSRQNELIDMLLAEQHTGRRRMLLQLLRAQSYSPDSIRTDFLDYCLSRINAESEPYAIRAFSIYCAFNICRHYPELLAELDIRLSMLSLQSPGPGLASALRTTRRLIGRLTNAPRPR